MAIVVRTFFESKTVELYGENGAGIKIPDDQIEQFIIDLGRICVDTGTIYDFNIGDVDKTFRIPGNKVVNIIYALSEVKDIGTQLGSYEVIF